MGLTARAASSVGAALAVLLLLAGPAAAGRDQEMVIQDDPRIVFAGSDEQLDQTMGTLRSLGVDRVRVTVLWHLIAPSPNSRTAPAFGPRGPDWPASYPPELWHRYDRIVRSAARHDLDLLFSISGPAPVWATRGRGNRESIVRPSPEKLRDFVTAVGLRYSGRWIAEDGSGRIPRISAWSVWNEPNFPGWLQPQWKGGRRAYPFSAHRYRRLVDAMWSGLQDSSHAGDIVLLGETAPLGLSLRLRRGPRVRTPPLTFIRELYCLNARSRPLRGFAAARRGCPRTRSGRRAFRSAHPALFRATGWAHHPYSLVFPPTWRGRTRDDTPLGAISRIGRAIDRAQRGWGGGRRQELWITEYGYQTRPDPVRAVPFGRQAAWMSWAENVAFKNRRVRSFAQFLLNDDAPDPRFSRSSARAWITWQSGLLTNGGSTKPAFREFPLPIYVAPRIDPRGGRVRVFGAYRPGAPSARLPVSVQFRRRGGAWHTLRSTEATSVRNYVNVRVRVPRSGAVRLLWTVGADRVASRPVSVKR